MNTYKIVHKDTVVIAVNVLTEDGADELASLAQQDFTIVDGEFVAENQQEALAHYHAEKNGFSFAKMLFFCTDQLNRSGYLFISLILSCIGALLMYGFVGNVERAMYGINSFDANQFLFIGLFIGIGGWVGLTASVSRWRNCGHSGWLYLLVIIIAGILDSQVMNGAACALLLFYLCVSPSKYAKRRQA